MHAEAVPHLHRTLSAIRALGAEPGVALNPGTSLAAVEEVLPLCHHVLVMSVNPGFGGQRFIPEAVDKARHRDGPRRGRRGEATEEPYREPPLQDLVLVLVRIGHQAAVTGPLTAATLNYR